MWCQQLISLFTPFVLCISPNHNFDEEAGPYHSDRSYRSRSRSRSSSNPDSVSAATASDSDSTLASQSSTTIENEECAICFHPLYETTPNTISKCKICSKEIHKKCLQSWHTILVASSLSSKRPTIKFHCPLCMSTSLSTLSTSSTASTLSTSSTSSAQ
jgi:hypothetical protein